MRKIAIFFFCLTNLFLSYYYLSDIAKYYSGEFSPDGYRYWIPFAIADSVFIFCLIIMLLSSGVNKYFFGYLLLAFGHNFAFGTGIRSLPFVGLITVLVTVVYIFRFDNGKPSA